mmetsp:Transcript_50208/g.92848  ORF Transcript_50208/g.92848 Transcript_50208/m.92848 type:complete len:263 (-) Transcript_50208:492-1280(-)
MQRWGHELETRTGTKFCSTRDEWTNYPNVKKMYDLVYRKLHEAGVAEELPERNGQQKDVVKKGTRSKKSVPTSDGHFTLLGFTAATGEPVMCAVIFCTFRGKTVPCFCCCSPNGSITSELLARMMKKMDDLDLFPRVDGGPTPVVLLDGHQSRLLQAFLEYVNDDAHLWFALMGLPYGTSPEELNLHNDYAGSVLQTALTYTLRTEGRNNKDEAEARAGYVEKELSIFKKWTSGTLYNANRPHLDKDVTEGLRMSKDLDANS